MIRECDSATRKTEWASEDCCDCEYEFYILELGLRRKRKGKRFKKHMQNSASSWSTCAFRAKFHLHKIQRAALATWKRTLVCDYDKCSPSQRLVFNHCTCRSFPPPGFKRRKNTTQECQDLLWMHLSHDRHRDPIFC